MKYKISYKNPHKHFINIEFTIEKIQSDKTLIQIPAWRPGRYELQNYARNIRNFEIFDSNGQKLQFKKINRESYEVETNGINSITVVYECYCNQMDAGGALLDENQLYLNFIYCLVYVPGRENEKCSVTLDLPNDHTIACGLLKEGTQLFAQNYYQLSDSPLIASPNLIHKEYLVNQIPFHIWVEGEINPEWEKILDDFQKFTTESINLFGEFPEKEYHFLFQIPPFRHYHGVEHSNSTVIVLGPAEKFNTPAFYENLLGISCHELFHAWNALKIRPVEMMPYDYTKENYFRTGFVIEGVTTYYGDLLLARSGTTTQELYFNELNSVFQKYFENFGRFNLSVADSSFDLWIDGYSSGIPNRKVSIYVNGAVLALILDLELRRVTGNRKSLDDAMRALWQNYGKKGIGYSEENYRQIIEEVAGQSLEDYFSNGVYATNSLEDKINKALNHVGCELNISENPVHYEKSFGFKARQKEDRAIVDYIEPDSPADKILSLDDEIIAVDNVQINKNLEMLIGELTSAHLTIIRSGKEIVRTLNADGLSYINKYTIQKREGATEEEKNSFNGWLKQNF